MNNPAEDAVEDDLTSPRFKAGVVRKQWRVISFAFPMLIVSVAAVEPDGKASEYAFRFELTGFPGAQPEALIWDTRASTRLALSDRPKGSSRVVSAFQDWGSQGIYRPWERSAAPHNNFARDFPDLAWHPKRDLAFIMEDLHGLLTSNASKRGQG